VSHFSVVRDSSLALRDRLFGFLTTVPDVDFGFSDVTTDIVLSPPDDDLPDTALLSIYLYHIEPDPQLRNQPPLADGTTGLLRAPLALQHHFLITPLLQEEDQNQLILGRVLQALHDNPFIEEIAGEPLSDSRGGGSPALRLAIEPMTSEERSRIWQALGADSRLSISYLMRTVMIDSALDARQAGRVTEAHVAVAEKA
jgi:hypothetical protein